jgi:hypothetical protein
MIDGWAFKELHFRQDILWFGIQLELGTMAFNTHLDMT